MKHTQFSLLGFSNIFYTVKLTNKPSKKTYGSSVDASIKVIFECKNKTFKDRGKKKKSKRQKDEILTQCL